MILAITNFIETHSLDEPSIVESSEITPHMQLIDPVSDEYSLDFAPTPPISPLLSSLPILSPSFDPFESNFIESVTFMLGNPSVD